MNLDFSQLRAGDKVFVVHRSEWARVTYQESHVVRITTSGRIRLDNGDQFDRGGWKLGDHRYRLDNMPFDERKRALRQP